MNSSTVTRALNSIETASVLQKREKEQEEINKKTLFLNKIKNGISKTLNSFYTNSNSLTLNDNLFKLSPRKENEQSFNKSNSKSKSKSGSKFINDTNKTSLSTNQYSFMQDESNY